MATELQAWMDPGDKVVTGELVGSIPPQQWSDLLGRVAGGTPVPEALKSTKVTRYALDGAIRTDAKAREQYEEAKIAALWRDWDFETLEEIMVAIMTNRNGGYLNAILDDMGLSGSGFYRLMARDPLVKEMYEEARQIQAEISADEMQRIADYGLNDTYTDDKGRTRVDQDVVQRSRLRVDTMKWRLAKLHHRRFGDRIQQDVQQNIVVDHAERLEMARKRRDELNAKRTGG